MKWKRDRLINIEVERRGYKEKEQKESNKKWEVNKKRKKESVKNSVNPH